MKKTIILNLLFTIAAFAGVPLDWRVDVTRVEPIRLDAYHGETLSLEASLQSYGKPLAVTNEAVSIYWQTNGMADVWWSAPAAFSNNVVRADFTPAMDPGAPVVRGFLGVPGEIYRAEFQIRFRPSPGATPNEIEFPPRVIDFATIAVTNAPWTAEIAAATNDVCNIVTNVVTIYDCEGVPEGATDIAFSASEDVAQFEFRFDGVRFIGRVYDYGFPYEFWCWDIDDIDPREFYVTLYRIEHRNALGLARLEDIPDNIVTTDNVESEVTRQLNGVDQVRSRRLLRMDGPCEYGNGWGVMIYDFTSDRRWWEIKAPPISSVSVSASSPLSNLSPASRVVRSLVRTDGTNGVDRCSSATWRVAVLELDDGSYGLDITASATNGTVSIVSVSGGGPGASIAYGNANYYQQHYIFRNFRPSQTAGSTVYGLYDYAHKPIYSSNYTTYSNQTWSVTLGSSASAYVTVTNEYLRVINTLDHHRFYDPGLRCTWEIAVTNGCFFAEQVSTNNLPTGGVW